MKIRKAIAGIGIVFTLSGCAAGYQWVKPGATYAEFEQDKADCQYQAILATSGMGSSGGYYRTVGQAAAAGIAEGIAIGLQRNEIATACMQAKGYRLEVIPQSGSTTSTSRPSAAHLDTSDKSAPKVEMLEYQKTKPQTFKQMTQ